MVFDETQGDSREVARTPAVRVVSVDSEGVDLWEENEKEARLTLEGVKVNHLAVEGDECAALEAQRSRVGRECHVAHFVALLLVLVVARQQESRVHLHAVRLQRRSHRRLHVAVVEASRLRKNLKVCTCTSSI